MDDQALHNWITAAASPGLATPAGRTATLSLAGHLLLVVAANDEQGACQVRRVLHGIVYGPADGDES